MKVEVVSRKLIKPCISTPTNLQNFKLSYLDELVDPMYFHVLLYYSSYNGISNRLEESLAEILSRFYPLAGRYIKKKQSIDCSDQGVLYVQAQVDCHLVELINAFGRVKSYEINDLIPHNDHSATDPLLTIQVNSFKCGGLAIGISASHKVVDASSIDTFIAAWMSASRGDNAHEAISPVFNSPVLFPGSRKIELPETKTERETTPIMENPKIVVRRFLFDKRAISSLRAKVMGAAQEAQLISRVRIVSALIIKAFAQIDQKKYGKSKGFVITNGVNIRGRTNPPLPKYSCGNLSILCVAQCTSQECENMEFQDFVHFLGDNITKTLADCAQLLSDPDKNIRSLFDTAFGTIARSQPNDANFCWFTDWSKFKFYDADFGWGRPIWVSIPNTCGKNVVLLMNNKGSDGIEAWVHLDEKDMPYFEEDEDIQLFTS